MIFVFHTQRITRVPAFAHSLQILLQRIISIQANHILPRHHYFTRYTVSKIENIIDQAAFHMVKLTAAFAGADDHSQFVFTA